LTRPNPRKRRRAERRRDIQKLLGGFVVFGDTLRAEVAAQQTMLTAQAQQLAEIDALKQQYA